MHFIFSTSGSDEEFLKDMKKKVMENGTRPVKHVRIAYDNNNEPVGDSAVPWLEYFYERVLKEHYYSIEKFEFDFEFRTRLTRVWDLPVCFHFKTDGNAARASLQNIVDTLRNSVIYPTLSKRNVDVTVCGINFKDMRLVVVD